MIRIGAWSAVLLVLALEIAALALLLARAPGNRRANRCLAAALAVVIGLLIPFIIGYAGAYDAWPWLTFAPFAVPLALGPLLYAHLRALVGQPAPGWPHWVAPLLQFGLQAALFPLPLADKSRIDDAIVVPWAAPLAAIAVVGSMAGYALAGWRLLADYTAWLRQRRRIVAPAQRLRAMLGLLAILLIARSGYELFALTVRPVTYFDLFAYYILLGLVGVVLGVEGWRNAAIAMPAFGNEPAEDPGAGWIARLRDEGWWRDPELSAEALARHLGTNRLYLSRGLALHGGFNAVVAQIRAEAVAGWIADGRTDDLLSLALEAGFGSKASFNRAFRARYAIAPSTYRREGADAAKAAMLPD